MAIYVIDEVMGRGKTTAMTNFINQSDQEQRYLYVTPYLTEVDRVIKACAGRDFFEPEERGGKLRHLKRMLASGTNIVSTHVLFSMLDKDCLESIRANNYILVMDEVTTVFEPINIDPYDAQYIRERLVEIGPGGHVTWRDKDYNGIFKPLKNMVTHGNVVAYTETNWVHMMDPSLFTSFKDVYLMTYMFDCQIQRCYFDLVGLEYSNKYVNGHTLEEFTIGDDPDPVEPIDYRELITIFEDERLNRVGDMKTALSKGWYVRHTTEDSLRELKNATYNFFQNKSHAKSSELIWTTFLGDDDQDVQWKKLVSGKGYSKGFLSCNARGTNQYKDRDAVAYLVNRYPNPMQLNFFRRHGIQLDQERFALSEMLQWLWRSAIRDGKPIDVFVPSSRMRALLKKWIAENSPA